MAAITRSEFAALMESLAGAWETLDAERAVECFTADAVYLQPPDLQFYEGHDQLKAYFGALTPGTYLDFHNEWFDEASQVGCVEFSFGVRNAPEADHGTIVVVVRNGLIAQWREYVQPGPGDFARFIATDHKDWAWHIGNYP
jgi:hypothetical protein